MQQEQAITYKYEKKQTNILLSWGLPTRQLEQIILNCPVSQRKIQESTSYKATMKIHWPISEVGAVRLKTFSAMKGSDPISYQLLNTLIFKPLWLETHKPEDMQFSTQKRGLPASSTLHSNLALSLSPDKVRQSSFSFLYPLWSQS